MIVNPAAGGRPAALWRRLEPQLRSRLPHLSVCVSTRQGDAERRVAAWAGERGDGAVLVLGGDGTIHEVVNGLLAAESDAALGLIPAGGGNDFARNLGIPLDSPSALARLESPRIRRVDLGRCALQHPNGHRHTRYFINSVSLGVSARANRIAGQPLLRWLPGRLRYPLAGLAALLIQRPAPCEVHGGAAGLLHAGPALDLTLANGACFGGGLRISPGSAPDDGVLDLVVIAGLGRLRALRAFRGLRRGSHLALPEVRVTPLRTAVRISAPAPLPLELDGEDCGIATALTVELVPGRLPVLS